MEGQWYWSTVAYVYGRYGRPALYQLNKISAHPRIDPALFPFAYVGTVAKEQLLATLERGHAQHSSPIATLKEHRPTRQGVTSLGSRTSSGDWVCDAASSPRSREWPQFVRLITPSGRLRPLDIIPGGGYYAAATATSRQSSWKILRTRRVRGWYEGSAERLV
jgi:hypothetical protein